MTAARLRSPRRVRAGVDGTATPRPDLLETWHVPDPARAGR
jgi:hypothetical protein